MSITKNFDVAIIDKIDGDEIKFNGKPLTAKRAIQLAFFNPAPGDENDPDTAANRYLIGNKVSAGGDIAFTPEELTAIRNRIRRYWTAAQITGQIEDIIDAKG